MQPNPNDCVIYFSTQDDRWISHSLHTDQIGLGPGPLYALADMLKAVQQVMKAAADDETIQPWMEAPASVQEMFKNADPLPKEMCEVAYWMDHGRWPDYLRIECSEPHKKFAVRGLEPTTA